MTANADRRHVDKLMAMNRPDVPERRRSRLVQMDQLGARRGLLPDMAESL